MTSDAERKRIDRRRIETDVVAKYYGDPEYRRSLERDPAGTLRSEGLDIPEGVTVELQFDSAESLNIVLPRPKPQSSGSDDGDTGARG